MSPLPSKFLIWWHKAITSPLEMIAIANFHQVYDATLYRLQKTDCTRMGVIR
jgi:hypothetical protein